jgi:hypothetical protein
LPIQTYFVPLKEDIVLTETFQGISPGEAKAPVQSYTSIAIGVSDTVIWYDHHEDGGYEDDPTNPKQQLTEIWGDGNPDNGIPPGFTEDVLEPGDVIVLHSYVPYPRGTETFFDGGDKIMSSFGIAVTRGCFPYMKSGDGDKGSMLAGAVEVLDTTNWGKKFETPFGEDSVSDQRFEQTQVYVMASQDGTEVTIESTTGPKTHTLMAGESIQERVNMGAKVEATKNIQVDILAGDIGSTYEMRWFSLLPTSKWSKEYLSPVGNSKADVIAYVYNPKDGPDNLSVQYGGDGSKGTISVPKGGIASTAPLNTGAGTYFVGSSKFMVVTIVDTVNTGQIYDWGVPVAPLESLTSQVLVGWGDGCTNDFCGGHTSQQRSEIWISPSEDAQCTVDFDNDGNKDEFEVKDGAGTDATTFKVSSLSLNKYEAATIWDHNDKDMTGAMIYCENTNGPVPFAAVWGQNPDQSKSGDVSVSKIISRRYMKTNFTHSILHFVPNRIMLSTWERLFLPILVSLSKSSHASLWM